MGRKDLHSIFATNPVLVYYPDRRNCSSKYRQVVKSRLAYNFIVSRLISWDCLFYKPIVPVTHYLSYYGFVDSEIYTEKWFIHNDNIWQQLKSTISHEIRLYLYISIINVKLILLCLKEDEAIFGKNHVQVIYCI